LGVHDDVVLVGDLWQRELLREGQLLELELLEPGHDAGVELEGHALAVRHGLVECGQRLVAEVGFHDQLHV